MFTDKTRQEIIVYLARIYNYNQIIMKGVAIYGQNNKIMLMTLCNWPLMRQSKLQQTTFFFHYYSEETSNDISCESSAKQTIHYKISRHFL